MKTSQYLIKRGLSFFISSLFILSFVIQQIKADECVTLEKAISLLGDSLKSKFDSQTVKNCCDYTQVTCENIDGTIHITGLKFTNIDTFFSGNEADAVNELSALPNLYSLEFSSSSYSKLPGNFEKLKNLKSLILSNNNYNDQLPEDVSRIATLEVLDMSNGFLEGPIPESYCNLKNLKKLILHNNRLKGTIPYCFKTLENIEVLDLSSNFDLNGYVPNFPKINSCNYDFTKLCTLKSTKCSSGSRCSENDIKSTNSQNGNPNPNSGEYDNEVSSGGSIFDSYVSNSPSSTSKIENEADNVFNNFFKFFFTAMGLIFLIPLTIIISVIVIVCCVVKKNSNNKNKKYNVLVNNQNKPVVPVVPVETGTTAGTVKITYTDTSNINNNNETSTTNANATTASNVPASPATTTNEPVSTPGTAYIQMPQPVSQSVPPVSATYNPQTVPGATYVPPPMPGATYMPPSMPGAAYVQPMPGAAYVPPPMPGATYIPTSATPYPPTTPQSSVPGAAAAPYPPTTPQGSVPGVDAAPYPPSGATTSNEQPPPYTI